MTIERKHIVTRKPDELGIKVACANCITGEFGIDGTKLLFSPTITPTSLTLADNVAETHNAEFRGRHLITIYEFRKPFEGILKGATPEDFNK